jgi:polyribonucleotide nucleotidyltransferase
VQYIEKSYAVGKIPGGYIKRETKPGDFETLTSRIVDRSLRPLFPKDFRYPTQITIMVLSCGSDADLQVLALNAASAALYLSDAPVEKSVCGIRIGKVDDEIVINPDNNKMQDSTLDLYVAGTKDELLMIEMRSLPSQDIDITPEISADPMLDPIANSATTIQNMNEVSNEKMVELLSTASEKIQQATNLYEEYFTPYKKEILEYERAVEPNLESVLTFIDEIYKDEVKDAVASMAKSERASELKKIAKKILQDEVAISSEWDEELVSSALNEYKRGIVRGMILDEGVRADGRGVEDVRPISIETNILPNAHGSCLFTRGETQALAVITIGSDQDAQSYDLLTNKMPLQDKFMVNYNFPGFSVGEASPIRAPGRRELGHGNLAKRAIYPSIEMDYPNTLRLVSEILESNGSSSMATVCGGSLALRAADVQTLKLVAGVAMGLIIEGDKKAILTDIMGLEDHDGDMDFKVAGTKDGITAMQMDIKLGGIDKETLSNALEQASRAREHILNIMEEANEKIVVNRDILPSHEVFSIDPSKIVDIIGKAGATIREIIEKFDVYIDLDRENGTVKVGGENESNVKAAVTHIKEITSGKKFDNRRKHAPTPQFEKGQTFKGKVKKIVEFGAFVELPGGVDGLIHISKLSKERIKHPSEVINEGDSVEVRVLAQKGHKIELELKDK